tara:strand:- start:164 stop:1003 length:840 start_codon:yes stop_codon:yes gene_type:complete
MTIKINGANQSTTPGITSGDTDTGFVFGSDNVKLSIGGTQKIEVDSSGQVIVDTDRVKIDASGKVGIGTSSPSHQLHIKDATDGFLRIEGHNNASVYKSLYLGISNAATQADMQYPGIFRFYDSEAGAERLRVQENGGISFNGDTAAANALDDYEEGSWTPTVNSGTCTVQSAAYTKIGRYVHAHCRIHSFSGTSGGFHLTGLPYAIDNNVCNDQNVGTAWGIGVGSTGEFHFWSQTSGLVTSTHAYAGGSSNYTVINFGTTITGSSNLLIALHYISST